MSDNLYETLGVNKSATQDEIKKAYRKQAMKYHPDKNKGDATAEKKFKEANSAYQTLSDEGKRQQYDTFWSTGWAWGNPFWGWGNPFSGAWSSSWGWFGWFEDMFSGFWGGGWSGRGQNVEFDFWDLFWNMWWWQGRTRSSSQYDTRQQKAEKPVTLDFEKTYEVPVFDMILGYKIEVSWVYGQKAKLTIPAGTKSWSKFRVKEFWKSEWSKKWNLIVKVEAKMPKTISDIDKGLIEQIRDNIGY